LPRNGHVCGRFGEDQLSGLNNYLAVQEKPGFSWKRWTIAAAVTSLFAVANVSAQERTIGKVLVSGNDNVVKGVPIPNSITYITVKGKIVDGNDSTALPGATVRVKGTTIGTVTNPNGGFMLRVPSTADTLVISLVGFQSYETKVGDFANGDKCVSLKMNAMMLGEPAIVMRKRPNFIKRCLNKVKGVF
jgi:hypothetical protein